MTISHVYLKIRILSHCALLPVQAATSEQVCKHGLRAHVYRPTSLHFGSFLGQGCIAGSSGTGKKASVPNTRRRLPTHPATGDLSTESLWANTSCLQLGETCAAAAGLSYFLLLTASMKEL